MAIISSAMTLANIMALVDAGGTPDREQIIELLVEGHYANPPETGYADEPIDWTWHGKAILKFATVEYEAMQLSDPSQTWRGTRGEEEIDA